MQSIFGASLQIFLDFTQYSAVQYSPSRRSYNHAIELTIMYQIDLANQASFVEITEKNTENRGESKQCDALTCCLVSFHF